jgi:copper resistance protein C
MIAEISGANKVARVSSASVASSRASSRAIGPSARLTWATGVAMTLLASGALAHAIATTAHPAAGATVRAGTVDVVVEFNARIDRRRSRLLLHAPGGGNVPVALDERAPSNVMRGTAALGDSGRWEVRWQVLSQDGHITRGVIPFVVAP